MSYEITAEQYEVFATEVRRLWALWGMSGWELVLEHFDLPADVFANCGCNPGQRSIRIRLCKKSPVELTDDMLRESARHEMCHAIVEPLDTMGCCRYVTEDELNQASHEVLRRLIVLLPK
jgi:hypothetical protein